MLQKKLWILLLFVATVLGCSEKKEAKIIPEKLPASSFELALEESKELILLFKNNLIVIDSTNVGAHIVSHSLEPEDNSFRTELNFGTISLKKVFKCTNDIINVVHFDFYYDSSNLDLDQDTETILEFIQSELGEFNSSHSGNSMKTYTWKVSNNIIDYELFKNGYTFTIRKNKARVLPIVAKTVITKQLQLADRLINCINNDSINFKSTMSEVQNLFKVGFKGKTNVLAFSETYDENILLSGSFQFDGDMMSAVYFDYMYSDSMAKDHIADSKLVKSMITELYDAPTEVATTTYATTYKWGNTPIVIEVYGDGFSILLEKVSL